MVIETSDGRRKRLLLALRVNIFIYIYILLLSFQISKDPIFVPGVWGPYFSAMIPGFWLNEGGQSVTGKLVSWHFFIMVFNVFTPETSSFCHTTHIQSIWKSFRILNQKN